MRPLAWDRPRPTQHELEAARRMTVEEKLLAGGQLFDQDAPSSENSFANCFRIPTRSLSTISCFLRSSEFMGRIPPTHRDTSAALESLVRRLHGRDKD